MSDNIIPSACRDISVGDVLDLQGDIFADRDRDDYALALDYVTVTAVRRQGDVAGQWCFVVVHYRNEFTKSHTAFHPGHFVRRVLD